MSTEKSIADALRMLLTWADPNCGDSNGTIAKKMADYAQAVKALAAYDNTGTGLQIASHATIYPDDDGDYVLFCPNINAAMLAGRSEAEVLASITGTERSVAVGLPTDYRVTWEIDAFNATTPREAAEEARAAMTRAHTTATVFTVYGRDGSVTDVDLSEDEESDDE